MQRLAAQQKQRSAPAASRTAHKAPALHAPALRNSHAQQQQPNIVQRLAAAAVAASLLVSAAAVPMPAAATGLESIDLPAAPDLGAAWASIADDQRQRLAESEETFQKSDTLKRLLEKSEANKAKNKKAIQDKYCYRQAELGIGDCGGLRLIPGLTDSGKQDTPQWLLDLLGVEAPEKPEGVRGKKLRDLFDSDINP